MQTVKLSFRDFAQPNKRSGSIDMLSGYGAMQDGTELHNLIQQRLLREESNFQKEVHLKAECPGTNFKFHLSGRVDCVFETETEIIIEEIKSTGSIPGLVRRLEEQEDHPYRLQTLCYTHFYPKSKKPVSARLRLVSSLTQKEELFELDYDPEEFSTWIKLRLQHLEARQHAINNLKQKRIEKAATLKFPFESLRNGQKELLDFVEDNFTTASNALVQAPTGLGKTAGVLFPALKNALSRACSTIYLTPKNSQHGLAAEVLERLNDQGAHLRASVLTAKRKICMQEEPLCSPKHCPYAKDYYDKLEEHKILEELQSYDLIDQELLRFMAEKYEVCPFELNLDSSLDTELVICDYNYVFAPRVVFERMFLDGNGDSKECNLVIDEAHNLGERARGYFSPELSLEQISEFRELQVDTDSKLRRRWLGIINSCQTLIDSCLQSETKSGSSHLVTIDSDQFLDLEARINGFCLPYFESVAEVERGDPVFAMQRYWADFCYSIKAFDECDDRFFTTIRQDGDDVVLKITCCDASHLLSERHEDFYGIVGFSATLKPFSYHVKTAGFDEFTQIKEFCSPFPNENRKVMIIPQVSTRYRDRERSYGKIAEAIIKITNANPGNYAVFFPSFRFLETVMDFVDAIGTNASVIRQERRMTKDETQSVIKAMKKHSNILLAAVQGGVFAEGIDFVGSSLIGAIIIGPGLPQFDFERELLKQYYDKHFSRMGFEYAYIYPGMTKVIQAAGRVIRSETDRGLLVLIDDRFLEKRYSDMMPADWFAETPRSLVSRKILADIGEFWGTEK